MRTIRATLTACLSLTLASVASARIGETKEQCTARYGEVKGSRESLLVKSEGKADVFNYAGLDVVVEYRAGRAWIISYEGNSMNQKIAEKILANYEKEDQGGGAKWEDDKFLDLIHWNDTEGDRHAVLYNTPQNKLVVFDSSAVSADHKPKVWSGDKKADVATEAKPGEDPPAADDPPEEKKDPFDGF